MAESEECTFESVIRGHYIYKRTWRPLVGEVLTLEREEGNTHDRFAVSLLKDAIVVGHVPREFSRVSWHFLRHGGTITCEVTGQRKRGKGPTSEIPCVYSFLGSAKPALNGPGILREFLTCLVQILSILVVVANY